MQGRLENDKKAWTNINNILKDMPDFVSEWYINLKASRRTSASCLDYIRKARGFLSYINEDVKEVKPEDITLQACESYMICCQTKKQRNGLIVYTSDSYQLTVWCALNNFLKFMYNRNYIKCNFMEYINRPVNKDLNRINNERILLTQRDFNKILNAAKNGNDFMNGIFNNRDVLIILLFMTTGMRKTALSEINISDINMENKTLQIVDKGNKTHMYYLNEQTIDYLNKWLIDRQKLLQDKKLDALFINRNKVRIAPHGIWDIVTKYTEIGIGKKLSPHKLRAGFCSILYNKTHDIEFVRRVIGHSNIQTTQRYINTGGEERQKASKIMDDILNF